MKIPPLATLLSTFFLRYLAVERGVSPHTSASYRDAIKLLLQFAATGCGRSVDQLIIEDLIAPVVLDFLSHLETSRTNTVRTRNARWPPYEHFSAISLANSPPWPRCAAPFWRSQRRRRSALRWAISVSRNLVTCWRWLIARLGMENVITCSSAFYTTLARASKNFSI